MYKDNIYKITQNKTWIGAIDGSVCVCVCVCVGGGVYTVNYGNFRENLIFANSLKYIFAVVKIRD